MAQGITSVGSGWVQITDEEIILGGSWFETYKEELDRDCKHEVLYFSFHSKLHTQHGRDVPWQSWEKAAS
jgi:hypothetical protein